MRNNENILIKKNENTHSIIAEVKVFNALYILKEKGRRVKNKRVYKYTTVRY